jgi:CheY-like chemotaxis protein
MMGGTIWVESEIGKGSQFYFTVKLKLAEKPSESQSAQISMIKPNTKMKILLVEDNTVSQRVLCRMLKEKDHLVDVANNGAQALRLHGLEKYDAILMDIYMPEMDGIEAAKRIREKEGLKKHTPIIALTAYAPHAAKDQFIALGMDEHLSKPIEMEKLFNILERIFEKEQPHFNGSQGEIDGDQNGERQPSYLNKGVDEELQLVTSEISEMISLLGNAIAKGDIASVERISHKVKELSNQIDTDELKSSAFKIELSVRRNNLLEAAKSAKQFIDEFETYRKSVNC